MILNLYLLTLLSVAGDLVSWLALNRVLIQIIWARQSCQLRFLALRLLGRSYVAETGRKGYYKSYQLRFWLQVLRGKTRLSRACIPKESAWSNAVRTLTSYSHCFEFLNVAS